MVPRFCRFLLENFISGAPNKSRGWKMFLKKISGGRDAYSESKSRVVDPVLLLLLVLL